MPEQRAALSDLDGKKPLPLACALEVNDENIAAHLVDRPAKGVAEKCAPRLRHRHEQCVPALDLCVGKLIYCAGRSAHGGSATRRSVQRSRSDCGGGRWLSADLAHEEFEIAFQPAQKRIQILLAADIG